MGGWGGLGQAGKYLEACQRLSVNQNALLIFDRGDETEQMCSSQLFSGNFFAAHGNCSVLIKQLSKETFSKLNFMCTFSSLRHQRDSIL